MKFKEKHENIVIGLIVVFAIILAIGFFAMLDSSESNSSAADYEMKTTGSTDQGDVKVDITPSFNQGKLLFQTSFDTHDVDLGSYNLEDRVYLEIGGEELRPATVPSLQGHHPSGTIEFNVGEEPERFELIIEGIPAEEERRYKW